MSKWDIVCGNKSQGGLGVSDLRRKNWALLGKWWFRFGDGVGSLWKRVVRDKYYEGRCEVDITAIDNLRVSKLWKDIISIGGRSVRLRNMLGNGFRWKVGCGSRLGFWREKWVGDKSLRDLCPRLYALTANKEGLVSDMGKWDGDRWQWNMAWRRGRMGREKDEEVVLWGAVECVHFQKGREDVWTWVHDPGGKYSVRIAYEFLSPEECHLDSQLCRLIWCRLVPLKVSFFGWRLCLDRLPTKWNLQKRGVLLQQEGSLCGLCHEVVEEVNHLFCTCREAWLVWVNVLNWWGFETVMLNTVRGMAEFFLVDMGRIIGKELGACVFLVAAWYLWYWRNACVFQNYGSMQECLLDKIQMKSFFWVKNKVRGCAFSLYEWQMNPIDCALAVRRYKRMLKSFQKQHQRLI
ncbi:hypothetical protein SLEP1_g44512 [Rubroshorea leprosula]|uniref:Reverse transcriptase zinc-binding domain-containing protein n=1 Tax=Rubroshorea leprosula TaxID=152421 RepID=A0AAV5LHP1_9ROSI|nr:hypothetical protein SLEP1_g44512 [Rubroshorea leprosula]